MIDSSLPTEELMQGHVRRSEFAQNLLLLVGGAHAPELRNKLPDRVLVPGGAPLLLIAGDQRSGIALKLLQLVPVRRSRIAGSVLRPVRIGGGTPI